MHFSPESCPHLQQFHDHLVSEVSSLSGLSDKLARFISATLWDMCSGTAQTHKIEPDAYYISHNAIKQACNGHSGKFRQTIIQAGLCEVSENWSADRHIGRVYRPTESAMAIFIDFCASHRGIDRPSESALSRDKRCLPKAAILGKDIRGNRRKTRGQLGSPLVEINIGQVLLLIKELENCLKSPTSYNRFDETVEVSPVQRARRLRRYIGLCHRLVFECSATNESGNCLVQRYQETQSGRLMGIGFHLQNLPRAIRDAALADHHDFDIDCCHFRIFQSLCNQRGYHPETLAYLIANKKAFRTDLSERYAIPANETKKALAALLYGAPLSSSPDCEIGRLLSRLGDHAFIYDDDLIALCKEIRTGTHLILKDAKITRNKIYNELGKSKPVKKASAKNLSHLLMGYETLALDAVIREFGEQIVLLQHDGFVANQNIPTTALESCVLEATRIPFTYKSKIIE